MTAAMYGGAPAPGESGPRWPDVDPGIYGPLRPFKPSLPPAPTVPNGVAVGQQIMTEETIVAVEAYAAAMVVYLSLPRDQRAAVDRYIESARILTGRVDVDAETYQLASQLAAGMRKVAK